MWDDFKLNIETPLFSGLRFQTGFRLPNLLENLAVCSPVKLHVKKVSDELIVFAHAFQHFFICFGRTGFTCCACVSARVDVPSLEFY